MKIKGYLVRYMVRFFGQCNVEVTWILEWYIKIIN